jgi:serine/threonine-protein kinase RsbW
MAVVPASARDGGHLARGLTPAAVGTRRTSVVHREGVAVGRVATTGGAPTAEFASTPSSVTAARHVVRDDLGVRGLPDHLIQDCLLVVSELVANAIRHARAFPATDGRGRIRLGWSVTDEQVWVAVTDGGSSQHRPHVEHAPLAATHGRGLAIVDAIAREWGVIGSDSLVTVYAVVSA